MLDQEISNLLAFAETNLLLDELDCAQAARRIARLLKITEFMPVEAQEGVDAVASPNSLIEPLLSYALENKLVDEAGKAALKAEIMDALMLKPSEINDLFADTYAVNKQKAFDFLYDYCVKSGYVDPEECAKNDRWEAKELKSKIEIIINTMPAATTDGKYPKCALCHENEGYAGRANMRSVSTEIDGEEWFFDFSRHQYFDKHGVLVSAEHKPMAGGIDTMKKLALAADFIGQDGFVGVDSLAENGGAHNTAHEHFKTGFNQRNVPMLKQGYKLRLKSQEYPYLEMGTVDWYPTVIRFSHSNLEKTVEFAAKLIEAWKGYSDERIPNDGKSNFCSVVCRKVNGKYIFDVVLRSSALKRPRMAAEFDEIKAGALSITDLLGYVVLPNKLSEDLKTAQLYLDGTLAFDVNAKTPLHKMVERILKAQGGTVSKLEAKLNVHDEVDAVCEKILASTATFDNNTIFDFLGTLNIREL
ncbi:MAG: hypothetical protein HDT28_09610 [Clostridiales bacterium]|nr:hypothetical protein [Clostridiales bacterium]